MLFLMQFIQARISRAPTSPTVTRPPVTRPAPTYKRPQLKSLGTPSEPTGPSTAIQLEVIPSGKVSKKNPKIHFPLPGRGSNRAAARRSSHALEVGQVQILILSLTWGVNAFKWQVGSKTGRSFKFPTFPRRRSRSSQSWSLHGLCTGEQLTTNP